MGYGGRCIEVVGGGEGAVWGPVTKKDMQTPPSPLRSGHLYIKDEECAESYFRFFRFLVFELLVAKDITIRLQNKMCSEMAKFTEKIGIDLRKNLRYGRFYK